MKNRPRSKAAIKKTSRTPRPRKSTSAKPKTAARRVPSELPPILLEGDEPAPVKGSGPGQRFASGRDEASPRPLPGEASAVLPDAYGTKQLFLAPRDPHWLYAHWDLTREQQQKLNRLSLHRHLVLRIYESMVGPKPLSEIHVHPESRNWFVHVGRGNCSFMAVLGYYDKSKKWQTVSTSGATRTPPDSVSDDTSFVCETLLADPQLSRVVSLIKEHGKTDIPLMEAIQQLRQQGHPELPPHANLVSGTWNQSQEAALASLISMDTVRRVWIGSLEITEWLQEQLRRETASLGVSQFGISSLWSGALSSPLGPGPQAKGRRSFWFNVNAELIIYGATEPDAQVTIGGRPIQLRPDGSFSFRFALPDGEYELPAQAMSADGVEARQAALSFRRTTAYRGDVGAHPQDPALKPPRPEHVS